MYNYNVLKLGIFNPSYKRKIELRHPGWPLKCTTQASPPEHRSIVNQEPKRRSGKTGSGPAVLLSTNEATD